MKFQLSTVRNINKQVQCGKVVLNSYIIFNIKFYILFFNLTQCNVYMSVYFLGGLQQNTLIIVSLKYGLPIA